MTDAKYTLKIGCILKDGKVMSLPEVYEELNNNKEEAIIDFYKEVCRKAEDNMLKTGKLEGAHYAAMKDIVHPLINKDKT